MPKPKKRASASPKARGKRRLEEASPASSSAAASPAGAEPCAEPDSKRAGKLAKVMGREPAPATGPAPAPASNGGGVTRPAPTPSNGNSATATNDSRNNSTNGNTTGGRETPAAAAASQPATPASASTSAATAQATAEPSRPVHDVRKLPKKRKFDLAELESMQQEGPAAERPAAVSVSVSAAWERPPLASPLATPPPPRLTTSAPATSGPPPASVTISALPGPVTVSAQHVPVSLVTQPASVTLVTQPAPVTLVSQSGLVTVSGQPVTLSPHPPARAAPSGSSPAPPPPPLSSPTYVILPKREPSEGPGRPAATYVLPAESESAAYRPAQRYGEDLRAITRREEPPSPLVSPRQTAAPAPAPASYLAHSSSLVPVQIHIPEQPGAFPVRLDRPAVKHLAPRAADEQQRLAETRRILEMSRRIDVRPAEPRPPQTVPLPLVKPSQDSKPRDSREMRDQKPIVFSPGDGRPPRPPLTLAEWRGHRVLAKREKFYYPGVIKGVYRTCDVSVQFDGHPEPFMYANVAEPGRCDVISDAAPLSAQVTTTTRVAVRVDAEKMIFIEGVVLAVNRTAHLFKIKIFSQEGPVERWYSRPAVRVIQPPWFEELEEPSAHGGPSVVQVTPPGTTPVTPISGQSGSTAPSSGSDELRRQPYNEYDSEDDLKREDINFGPDGEYPGAEGRGRGGESGCRMCVVVREVCRFC